MRFGNCSEQRAQSLKIKTLTTVRNGRDGLEGEEDVERGGDARRGEE